MILFALAEMRTRITDDGLEVGFWPIFRRRIFRSEIREAKVRKYSPIGEYGGWGYRIGPGRKAFNMYGNQGLELTLTDGNKVMIGTQRPEELADFMREYLEGTGAGETPADAAETLRLRQLNLDELES